MKKSKMIIILYASSFLVCCKSKALNIIFDLGNVLIETQYLQSILNIGPINMGFYALSFQNPFEAHKKLYALLEKIKPSPNNHCVSRDYEGNILPPLMCDWLKGTISPECLLHNIYKNIDKLDNWLDENLITALARTIFIPEIFIKTRYIVEEGIEFVKECKAAGHNLYIISNWDPASFPILEAKYQNFFDLFTGIVISGNIKILKPDPEIYDYLIETYSLDPVDCLFIDDRPENLIPAQDLGMQTVHYIKKQGLFFEYPNFDLVREKINTMQWLKNFISLGNERRY